MLRISVGQDIGATEEVEYHQINCDEQMETVEVEYLDGDDENESVVWENEENSAAVEYDDDGEGYVTQSTMHHYTEYQYIQIITTETDGNMELVNEYPDLLHDTDSHHKRSLVLAAIEQITNNDEPSVPAHEQKFEPQPPPQSSSNQTADETQSDAISTTADCPMDIKAEIKVETPSNNVGENDVGPSRPKRQRKVVPAFASYMKNRANSRAAPKPSTSSGEAAKNSKPAVKVEKPDSKVAKANEKRKSATRKTISGSQSEILEKEDKTDVSAAAGK